MIYPIDTAFELSDPKHYVSKFFRRDTCDGGKNSANFARYGRSFVLYMGKRYKRRTYSLTKYNSFLLNLIAVIPIRLFLNVG